MRRGAAEPFLEDGDPRLGRIDSVGTTLRRAREGFGEDLRAVAETLKIRYVYLQAIEDSRYKDLPGATYAVGFIRTYADYLSLDGKDLVDRFKEEVEGLDRQTQLVFPTPVPESRIPGGALILISVLLVAVAYAGWAYLSEEGSDVVDLIPPVPERLQALVEDQDQAASPAGSDQATSGQSDSGAPAEAFSPAGTADEPDTGTQVAGDPASDPEGLDGSSADLPAAAPVEEVSEVPGRALTPVAPGATAGLTDPPQADAEEGRADQGGETEIAGEAPASEAPEATAETAAASVDAVPVDAVPEEPTAPEAPGQVAEAPSGEPTESASSVGAAQAAPAQETAQATAQSSAPTSLLPQGVAPPPEGLTLARLIDSQTSAGLANSGAEDAIPAAPSPEGVPTATPGRTPQVYGSVNEDARIVLRARLDSWVQVRDSSDDSVLIVRVLQEGDTYRVPNREGLTLRTGNAGGLEILVDGTPLGPIGPVGSVRSDIALDPEQLAGGVTAQ